MGAPFKPAFGLSGAFDFSESKLIVILSERPEGARRIGTPRCIPLFSASQGISILDLSILEKQMFILEHSFSTAYLLIEINAAKSSFSCYRADSDAV
jgi:hypothetical protein